MARLLTTNGSSYLLEGILMAAKEELIIITPVLFDSEELLQLFEEAGLRGTHIKLIFSEAHISPAFRQYLGAISQLTLYHHSSVNYRCYANEEMILLTSQDIHAYREKDKREMGMLLRKGEDTDLYRQAYRELITVLKEATEVRQRPEAETETEAEAGLPV